jgi:hypothetical protein
VSLDASGCRPRVWFMYLVFIDPPGCFGKFTLSTHRDSGSGSSFHPPTPVSSFCSTALPPPPLFSAGHVRPLESHSPVGETPRSNSCQVREAQPFLFLPFPTEPLTSPLFLSVRRSSLPPHDGDMPTERLTDDLLLEIISRVPSRQRWRCKRVCRRWLRLARTLPQSLAPALPWPASSTPPPARSASSTSQVTGAAR